jgi:HAD superfamily hydrolase (TIGR01549 family)
MGKIRAMIFDLSGTLYENEELDDEYAKMLYRLVSEARDIGLDESKRIISEKKKELEKTLGKHATKLSAMEALGFDRKMVHDAYCKVEPRKYLGKNKRLSDFLNALKRGYKLGLITNLRSAQAVKTLKALCVDEKVFNRIVGEEGVVDVKPASEPFLKMLSFLNLSGEECVYVSDSVTKDLMPAKKLGFKTVLVGDAEIKPEHEKFMDYRVKDVYGLKEVLEA